MARTGRALKAVFGAAIAVAGLQSGSLALAADVTYTLGSGPSNFDSHTVDAGADLGESPLRLEIGYYRAFSDGTQLVQFTGSLRWSITELDSLTIGGKQIDDEVMRIQGGSLSAGLNLNRLWRGKHTTTLNLGYARNAYSPEGARRFAAALVSLFPDQTSVSLGIRQDLPAGLSAGVDFTRYHYDRDPGDLARAIATAFARQRRNVPNAAFTLLGFPDRTLAAGLSWSSEAGPTLETNLSQTETVVDQRLRSVSVGLRQVSGAVTLGATLTRSASSEVLGPRGQQQVIGASIGTYLDFRIGLQF